MSYNNGPKIVTNGLVLYLDAGTTKSYPGSGTTWTNLSSNQYNGTLTNGPTYNSANKGSIVFDGSNDYVTCGPVLNFGSASSVGTILVLAKGSGDLVTNQRTSSNHGWIQTRVTATSLRLYIDAYDLSPYGESFFALLSDTPYSTLINQWNFYSIVINRPANQYTLGINNYFFTSTKSFTVASYQNFNTIEIGRMNNSTYGTTYFTGNISNVAVYNRVLSQNEILQNYNALKGRYNL